jgi:hypothetical protein
MKPRSQISLALVLTISTVFTFSSFAAQQPAQQPDSAGQPSNSESVGLRGPTASLSGTGEIRLNGNRAAAGATVFSGNDVKTGIDGDASIEMSELGRVQLRPDAHIKLGMDTGRYEVSVRDCSSITLTTPSGVTGEVKWVEPQLTEVAVTTGEVRVNVKGSGETILRAGETRTFNEGVESVIASGQALVTVNCCECDVPAGAGLYFFPAWWVWGTAGAVAAAVPVAIEVGDEDQPASPIRP